MVLMNVDKVFMNPHKDLMKVGKVFMNLPCRIGKVLYLQGIFLAIFWVKSMV